MELPEYVEIFCDEYGKGTIEKFNLKWEKDKIYPYKTSLLSKSPRLNISVVCEYCLSEGKQNHFVTKYSRFRKNIEKGEKICCYECRNKKMKETSRKKYGVDNPTQVKEYAKKAGDTRRTPIEKIKKEFESRNYELLTTSYENGKQELEYICKNHPEKGKKTITLKNFRNGNGCFQCGVEKISGKNHYNWKGGKTSLNFYLRGCINQWKVESMKNSNFKCVLTGTKENLVLHHLFPFHKIMEITFEELNFPIYDQISKYSKQELSTIINKLNEVHYRYPLGVALAEEVHKEFHKMDGDDENILETFFQYAIDYYGKEIKGEKAEYSPKKYFTYKTTGTSKYTGVSKGSKNRFTASIGFKGKTHYLGLFESEYDAAKAYNDKAIELFGPDTAINLLADEDLKVKEKLKYYEPVEDQTSRFHGISLHKTDKRTANRNDLYVSRITYNNERIQIGFFSTELEAAYHYNLKAIELFGDNAKLNKFTEEEEKHAKHLAKYFPHRENAETLYTSVRLDSGSWNCQITHEGVYHYVGRFKSDAEAAVAYNYYVRKHGLDRKLNFVEQEEELLPGVKEMMEQDDRYYPHKEKGKSIYSCIKQEKNGKWSAKTKIDKKEVYIPGRYLTDKEAAIAYNEYVLKHKLDKKLNKII